VSGNVNDEQWLVGQLLRSEGAEEEQFEVEEHYADERRWAHVDA
jgi:hypothetical protein